MLFVIDSNSSCCTCNILLAQRSTKQPPWLIDKRLFRWKTPIPNTADRSLTSSLNVQYKLMGSVNGIEDIDGYTFSSFFCFCFFFFLLLFFCLDIGSVGMVGVPVVSRVVQKLNWNLVGYFISKYCSTHYNCFLRETSFVYREKCLLFVIMHSWIILH